MKRQCCSVLAVVAGLGIMVASASAATVFSDDFSGDASSYWANPSVADYSNYNAVFNGVGDDNRIYLYTNDADYASTDFVAEVDLDNSVNRYAYFGLGQADPNPDYHYEPSSGIHTYLRQNATAKSSLAGIVVNSDTTNMGAFDYGMEMHVKLFWEAATSTATFCIDTNMDGGYEYIDSFVNTDLSGAGVPSRLFIGGSDGISADNFSVSFDVPEIPEVQTRVMDAMVLDSYTGKYYKAVRDRMNFADAKAYAESQTFNGVQGRLVEVNDAHEHELVWSCGQNNDVWLGLTDSETYGTTEGNWVWTGPNGETTPLSETGYTNWKSGEPNDYPPLGEDCAKLKKNGLWYDTAETSTLRSMVEFGGQAVAKGFYNKFVSGTSAVSDLTEARKLVNGLNSASSEVTTAQTATLNFIDPDTKIETSFLGATAFPNDNPGVNDDNFAMKSYATIVIPEAGTYTIGGFHDDLLEVIFDRGAQNATVVGLPFGDTKATVTYDAPGTYNIYCLLNEYIGEVGIQVAMGKGTVASAEGIENYALIGDTVNGGIATVNLRQIYTQSGFTTNGTISSDTVNFASTGTGSGNFGNDVTMDAGSAMSVSTQLVVPENSAGWWTLGVTQSQEGNLTILKDGQVVAFSQVNGRNNGAAVGTTGTMTWNAPSSGVFDQALGAVNLPAGTYDLVLDYNPNNQAFSLPKLNAVNGFEVINAIPFAGVTEIWGAVNLMLDVRDNQENNTTAASYVTENYSTINFDEEAAFVGHFSDDNYYTIFPDGQAASGDTGSYGVYVSAEIEVTAENAGFWSFCINSDDGFLMQIYDESGTNALSFNEFANDLNSTGDNTMFMYEEGRGAEDSFATIDLAEGTYQLMMVYWDGGGGGSLELSAAKGEYLAFDDSVFTLLGESFAEQLELFAAAGVHTEFDSSFDLLGGALNFEDQSEFYESEKIAGDANNDGKVDGSDVTILAANWQKGVNDGDTASWAEGDFNGDGKVDGSDVTILAGNWQYGVNAAAGAVPEPSMLILLLSSITMLWGTLRRR